MDCRDIRIHELFARIPGQWHVLQFVCQSFYTDVRQAYTLYGHKTGSSKRILKQLVSEGRWYEIFRKYNRFSPVHIIKCASRYGHLNVISAVGSVYGMLNDRGETYSGKYMHWSTPIEIAGRDSMDILHFMEGVGFTNWYSVVSSACKLGRVDILEYLSKQKVLLKLAQHDEETFMQIAGLYGQMNVVLYWMNKGVTAWNRTMIDASLGGRMNIVQLMIEKGANEWNKAMVAAAGGGQMHVVEFMITKGADNWNECMIEASKSGHMNIIELMVSKGADNWNHSMHGASAMGHMDIIKYMIDKGATSWDHSMYEASEAGHFDVVQLMIEKGATSWDLALYGAADQGHTLIVHFLLEKPITDRSHAARLLMSNAARRGCKSNVEFAVSLGADGLDQEDWEEGMVRAIQGGHIDIVEFMISKGAKDWNNGLITAINNGYLDVVQLMISKGADIELVRQTGLTRAILLGHLNIHEYLRTLIPSAE